MGGVMNVTVKLIKTLIYVLARGDSSLTSSTFAKGVLYLLDSMTCTICLMVDRHVLTGIKTVAVLHCAFAKTTVANLVIATVANFSTPMLAVPVR